MKENFSFNSEGRPVRQSEPRMLKPMKTKQKLLLGFEEVNKILGIREGTVDIKHTSTYEESAPINHKTN